MSFAADSNICGDIYIFIIFQPPSNSKEEIGAKRPDFIFSHLSRLLKTSKVRFLPLLCIFGLHICVKIQNANVAKNARFDAKRAVSVTFAPQIPFPRGLHDPLVAKIDEPFPIRHRTSFSNLLYKNVNDSVCFLATLFTCGV